MTQVGDLSPGSHLPDFIRTSIKKDYYDVCRHETHATQNAISWLLALLAPLVGNRGDLARSAAKASR